MTAARRTEVFVGTVVMREAGVLLVRQSAGHPLEGRWTIPWGRVEPGESPVAAALRETAEEGGVEARIDGLLGVQELPAPQAGGVALVYLCTHVAGDMQPRDRETDTAAYFSATALEALRAEMEPWSHWLVRRVLAGEYVMVRAAGDNPLQSRGAFF